MQQLGTTTHMYAMPLLSAVPLAFIVVSIGPVPDDIVLDGRTSWTTIQLVRMATVHWG